MEAIKHKTETTSNDDNNSYAKIMKFANCFIAKLDRHFFDVPCYNLANFLLGKLLVRKLDNGCILKARIIETECYLGGVDKASHSYQGRKTPGNQPMFMPPGTTYIYMTYGMYHCFNISSIEPGAAALVRAVDPIQGIDEMRRLRSEKTKGAPTKKFKNTELCNGPAKLCMSMDISKNNCNKLDLCESDAIWIETDPDFDLDFKVVTTTRIGVKSAGEEWAKKPLRFYILGNGSVSKRDHTAEKLFT